MSVTLHELLDALYGIKTSTHTNQETDVINSTVTKILRNNPNRVSFLVVNLSGNAMYIAPDTDVGLNRGIFLAANGGVAGFQWDRDFELCAMDWYGISTADAQDVYILENISV